MEVNEIRCRTILSKSGLYGVDYSINPYRGCLHGCKYCYAPYILRERREWGNFIDVKINAPEVLQKKIRRNKKGSILISSVTDAYNPIEKKYEITRKILNKLKNTNFSVSILTKSSLVLRDMDLLKQMNSQVGITVTTLDKNIRKAFEPNASTIEERLNALKELKENGIRTYIFFGPILPFTVDLKKIINEFIKIEPDYILVDRLNIKNSSHWNKIKGVLEKKYPELFEKWENVLFSENDYYKNIKKKIIENCGKLDLEFCY